MVDNGNAHLLLDNKILNSFLSKGFTEKKFESVQMIVFDLEGTDF